MISAISQFNYYFPWAFTLMFFIALVFLGIGAFLFFKGRIIETSSEATDAPSLITIVKEKIYQFFARYGYFSTDPLSQSFVNALKAMKNFIGGSQFKYQLPWYLILGSAESGKSTLLDNLDIDTPLGKPKPEEGEFLNTQGCDWWFFDQGIVLDLKGDFVLSKEGDSAQDEKWKLFLDLISHHRSKRPLDGVVLTIPSTEFFGNNKLSQNEIINRAEKLYNKLWTLQKTTGLRVPVYIVVTKCDTVPGFSGFCSHLPVNAQQDIFGWSNDNALDSSYNPLWISDTFKAIKNTLSNIQQGIFTSSKKLNETDSVFLFPYTFSQFESGLQIYANHIFKESAYHESFFLRGIYFVGDSANVSQLSLASLVENETKNLLKSSVDKTDIKTFFPEQKRAIFFVKKLFENKIFREVGLAQPVKKIFLGATSAMRIGKIAVVMATIFGTLGLLRNHDQLSQSKQVLVPALSQIEVTLEKVRGQSDATEVGRLFFDDQAQVLLNIMTQLKVSSLSSFFIPPSWMSNLNSKINNVMAIAYDHVIFRSMSRELKFKAEQLTSLGEIEPDFGLKTVGINPLETNEFYRLQNYIIAMQAFEMAADKFNGLGGTSNTKDIAEIIKYLFNFDMPASFFLNDEYYLSALKQTNLKIFDFNEFQNSATLKLNKLYSDFQTVAFDPYLRIPGLKQLFISLNDFEGLRNYASYDSNLLRNIYNSLQETLNTLNNPAISWIYGDHFTPGPRYDFVIGLIAGSTFFGKNVASSLVQQADEAFKNFHKNLASYRSPLLKQNLFTIHDEKMSLSLGVDIQKLNAELKDFFAYPFMTVTENKSITTQIPIGSILMWDTLRLHEANDLIKSYNDFVNVKLLNFPKELQPLLQKVSRESLTQNLIKLVSDAEVFAANSNIESASSPEDALLSQVQNYKTASPYLEQILFVLRTNNANTAYSTLKSFVINQNYDILKKLNDILQEDNPYEIKGNNFYWWNGQNLAGLEAFGVSNLNELKSYLDLQRARINYLAHEFAEPIVSFLKTINKEGMPSQLLIVGRWEGILQEISNYENKSAGNTLAELEDYILTTLNRITLNTCPKYASNLTPLTTENNYFVNIFNNIKQKLHEQCKDLAGDVSVKNYADIAQFFNANLAGKFPFVKNAGQNTADADPADIQALFNLIDSNPNNIKTTLQQAKNLGEAGKKAFGFIEKLENVRKFFGDFLSENQQTDEPVFNLQAEFRVNKQHENYGNQVIDWNLLTESSEIDFRSSNNKIQWKYGEPLALSFRWAANSALQPIASKEDPNLFINEGTATFSYSSKWALLRLLKEHAAKPSDFSNLTSEKPVVLRFDIPLADTVNAGKTCDKKAKIFVRLKVSSQEIKDSAKTGDKNESVNLKIGKPLDLPQFPYIAPKLSAQEVS